MVELATRKPRAIVKESLTPENCTAIIIGAAALIEAHVTFRPPLFRVRGWDTVQRTGSNLK